MIGNVAGGVEAPEARIDEEQADGHQPHIVGRDITRRAVGPELADARTEHDEEGERSAAGKRVDDARGVGIVIAPQFDHPALRVPAPCGVDYPQHRSDQNGDDPEGAGARPFDDRAGNDGCRRDREQEERAPEDAVEAMPERRVGRRDVGFSRIDAGKMRAHQGIPGFGEMGRYQAARYDARTVRKGEIDPPAEEIEGDGDQGDRHRILHKCFQMVAAARNAHLIGAEADMDEEHHDDGHPVVELGKNGGE